MVCGGMYQVSDEGQMFEYTVRVALATLPEIYSDVGRVETRCGILVRVLGIGFSSCIAPTFSDSPSISNTTQTKIQDCRDQEYDVRIPMSGVSLRDKSIEVKIEARV